MQFAQEGRELGCMWTWISKHSKSGEFRRAHVLFCVQMHRCTRCIRPACTCVERSAYPFAYAIYTGALVHMQHLARECARARGMLLQSAKQGKHRNALKTLTETIIFIFSRYNQYINLRFKKDLDLFQYED